MESADLDSKVPTGLDEFSTLQGHLKSYPTDSWMDFFTSTPLQHPKKHLPKMPRTKDL